jgi:ribosomal protein S25
MHFPRRKDPCTAVREAIDRAADQAAASVEKEKEKEDENEKEKEQGHPARTSDERPMSSADDDMQIERCVSAGLGH